MRILTETPKGKMQSVRTKGERCHVAGRVHLFSHRFFAALDDLDRAASLERAAHITLCLVEDLHAAQDHISAWASGSGAQSTGNNALQLPSMRMPSRAQDNEFAQFLLKLAPRIRTLESQTVRALGNLLEDVLQKFASHMDGENPAMEDDLLILGHCMRGLALLGRGKEVESIFARTAMMPLIRSLVSMGRLDQGGSRGECAGLVSLLEEITTKIQKLYGPILSLAEVTFCTADSTAKSADVDLLSEGVWVPIATAFMADSGIKMTIFSPGIASILQANYVALDNFVSSLAVRLLIRSTEIPTQDERFLYQPDMTPDQVERAQNRVYAHAKTAEFIKRWNLPIYYQLRFGESCNRLNKAVDQTRREGWVSPVFTGDSGDYIREKIGLELSFFQELYDILIGMWRKDVILVPLTNRFLRGAVQLVGRSVSFVSESMEGKIKFGDEPASEETKDEQAKTESDTIETSTAIPPPPPLFSSRAPYCWGESQDDVAAVAWELTVLESALMHEYVDTITSAMDHFADDLRPLVLDVLKEATQQIHPVIDKAWNEIIVNILTTKCSGPLAAVKGVAATYRMTNRPPPTQASHWVVTILRPLHEFCQQFTNRIPERVGSRWKQQVVVTVADRYAAAVKELLTTVERTENALRTRRTTQRRQVSASTLSDGEKVKLQVYLDYQTFRQSVKQIGIDPATVIGISQLEELTSAGVELQQRSTNDM